MSTGQTPLRPPRASRQITFHELLLAARRTWLIDGLGATLATVDHSILKQQLTTFVPQDVQQILARLGIRDEHVFPVPVVLEAQPTLVGYYRLITGIGQKSFYRSGTGMSPFQKMEKEGVLLPKTQQRLPDFCVAMTDVLAELIRAIAPSLTARDVAELQLLTLGAQFYGGANTVIGTAAIKGVMDAIAAVLGSYVTSQTARQIQVTTSRGRNFAVIRGSDPDVRVEETTAGLAEKVLAIEVKGGTDPANVYNRGGEAEKSHKAAKTAGFPECWTVILTSGIDQTKLRGGATSTDVWFDTSQVLAQQGPDWVAFAEGISRVVEL